MSARRSKLAKIQQQCVDELTVMAKRLEELSNGPALEPGLSCWFPNNLFAEGQINTLMYIASQHLRDVLEAFADCAEKGVEVQE